MSSATASAPAQPAPAAQATAPAPAVTGPPAAKAEATTSDTPRRLRALGLGVLWAGIVVGVTGLATFALLAVALGRAGASTEQLIRVQQIQTDLLSADASATNAFLVGGLEPAAQRQAYDAAIQSASTLIAKAARAEPADEQALSELNEQLVAYTGSIELARANNRQGFPVGAQYLKVASAGLRADALPILDNLVAANAERAAGQMDAREGWWFGVIGILGLAGFVLAQVWLARRFHRRFNPLLVVASGLIAITWLVSIIGLASLASSIGAIRSGAYADVNDAATARIQGYDAKSNESLTLVARGSGAAFEKAWQASAAVVTQRAPTTTTAGQSWQRYAAVHQRVRQLDDRGQWDAAVKLATSTATDGSNATFGTFDRAVTADVQTAATATTDGLRSSRVWLVVAAVLTLAAGAAAGVLGRRGVDRRLQEYR